jgi:hypothetical protein
MILGLLRGYLIARRTARNVSLLVDGARSPNEGIWLCLRNLVVMIRMLMSHGEVMLRWRGIKAVLGRLHILNHTCRLHGLCQFLNLVLDFSLTNMRGVLSMVHRWLLPMMLALPYKVLIWSCIIHSSALERIPAFPGVRPCVAFLGRISLIGVKIRILWKSAPCTFQSCLMIDNGLILFRRYFVLL